MRAGNPEAIQSAVVANVALQILPIFAALFSVPYVIASFGKELFTVYALAVSFIVGLNYVHLGIATNVNRDLAAADSHDKKSQASVFWTGALAMGALSLLLTLVFLLLISSYSEGLSQGKLEDVEAVESFFRTTVYQTPLVFAIIFFRAVLESRLKFLITAANRSVVNTLLLTSPVFIHAMDLPFGEISRLFLVTHVISLFFLGFFCRYYLLLPIHKPSVDEILALVKSGSSITLVSLGMLVFLYCDRFLLGLSEDISEAAYFIAPFDLLTRISFIYGSIGAVFFPVFSKLLSKKQHSDFRRTYDISFNLIFLAVGLVSYFAILFSDELLEFWLGLDFRLYSSSIMKIIAAGVFFTGLASIPNRALIASKQEGKLGLFYSISALGYVIMSFFAIKYYGAIGASYAFLVRSIVELVGLKIILVSQLSAVSPSQAWIHEVNLIYIIGPVFLIPAFLFDELSLACRTIFATVLCVVALSFFVKAWFDFRMYQSG